MDLHREDLPEKKNIFRELRMKIIAFAKNLISEAFIISCNFVSEGSVGGQNPSTESRL